MTGVPVSGAAPTDRKRNAPDSEVSDVVGVDTIALRGRVHRDTMGSLPRQRVRRDIDVITGAASETETSAEVWVADGVMIRADHWRGSPEVMMECSIPKLLYGDNTEAASVSDVRHATQTLWQLVGEHVRWECEPQELVLMRLDIVRDFQGVVDANRHLAGLARVPARRAMTHPYMAVGSSGVQTLYRETTRWKARLYLRSTLYEADDEMRTGVAASPHQQWEEVAIADQNRDRLRYELQLRRRGLEEEGVALVSDLSHPSLWALAEKYFHRCRFGTPVGSVRDKALAAVNTMVGSKSANHVRATLGQLWLDALMPSNSGDATVTKYRNEAKNLDLYAGELLDPWGSGPLRALDFRTGSVVEKVRDGVVSAAPLRARAPEKALVR